MTALEAPRDARQRNGHLPVAAAGVAAGVCRRVTWPPLARGDLRPYKRAPLHPRSEPAHQVPKAMSQAIELTKTLIARRSVTPIDEGCQQIMTGRLAAAGFQVERLSFGSVDNFWTRRGSTEPGVSFAGHTV